jgi:Domain of unknown function (DUF4386)
MEPLDLLLRPLDVSRCGADPAGRWPALQPRRPDIRTRVGIFILGDLVTSLGIIVLAVLLYAVLNRQNKIIALVALGCWLTEAMALAISKIGASALIPLSLEFVKAGAPEHSYYQTLGEFLWRVGSV